MKQRLIILGTFTLMSILFEIIFYSSMDEIDIIGLLASLCGIFAIVYEIWSHVRFRFADHFLVFEQPFRQAQSVDLEQLESWTAHSYYIRGQHRKSLVLFPIGKDRIVIDNHVYSDEFEKVNSFLAEKQGDSGHTGKSRVRM